MKQARYARIWLDRGGTCSLSKRGMLRFGLTGEGPTHQASEVCSGLALPGRDLLGKQARFAWTEGLTRQASKVCLGFAEPRPIVRDKTMCLKSLEAHSGNI